MVAVAPLALFNEMEFTTCAAVAEPRAMLALVERRFAYPALE